MNDGWDLEQWLHHLEHRYKQAIHLRLVNAEHVARSMNVLHWPIPVITVGGTNGKGSTVAAISAIYQAAGYRVGQFTSPHLLRFNERICINQQPISDLKLCELFQDIEISRGETSLTYFETSFLAALLYFKESDLDVVILEVGLGGRLDATNIIDADLAIITTIDMDHQEYLGNDKEAIGKEKAGILRQYQPFIYADFSPPKSILDQAQILETNLYCLGVQYNYCVEDGRLQIQHPFQDTPLQLPLPSLHQHAAVAAVMASLCLQTVLPVCDSDWVSAMQTMCIAGRQQWIPGDIGILYDVAHNPQASQALAQSIKQTFFKQAATSFSPSSDTLQAEAKRVQTQRLEQRKVHAVFSALKDKDICGLIRPLSSIVEQWYPAYLSGERASSSEQLLAAFTQELGIQPHCYENPLQAIQAATAAAKPGDLIVVYGSFVLVGAVMSSLSACRTVEHIE